MVVVHLDEFIQIYSVQVKDDAKMIPPHEVVYQFYDTLNRIWVILFKQEQQLGFNGRLVVVLLLVFHHFDCNVLSRLVVFAF